VIKGAYMQTQTRQVRDAAREERIAKLERGLASLTSKGLSELHTHHLTDYMHRLLRTPIFRPNGTEVDDAVICSAETLNEARERAIRKAKEAKANGYVPNGNWYKLFISFAERMRLIEGFMAAATVLEYEAFDVCYSRLNELPHQSVDLKQSITIANEFKKHAGELTLAIIMQGCVQEHPNYVQTFSIPHALDKTENVWQAGYGAVEAVEVKTGSAVVFGYSIKNEDLAPQETQKLHYREICEYWNGVSKKLRESQVK